MPITNINITDSLKRYYQDYSHVCSLKNVKPLNIHDWIANLHIIDTTKEKTLLQCPRLYYYKYMLFLTTDNYDLKFGRAVHLGIEHLLNAHSNDVNPSIALKEAIEIAKNELEPNSIKDDLWLFNFEDSPSMKNPKNLRNIEIALKYYQEYYLQGLYPYVYATEYVLIHTENSKYTPIYYNDVRFLFAGKFDAVVKHHDTIYMVEHKTTSMYLPLWLKYWKDDLQVLNYQFLGQKVYNEHFGGVWLDGLSFQNSKKEPVSLLLHPVEWKQSLSRRAYDIFLYTLIILDNMYKGILAYNTLPPESKNCYKYNKYCPFAHICEHVRRIEDLKTDDISMFNLDVWNPLN